MSENGRKRCRKSKLVPREFADLVEDDFDLQEPAKKKLVLQKIKKESDDFVPKESSSHEFSVRVEVEDVDGDIPDEDPSDYMKYLFSLSKESEETEQSIKPIENLEYVDNAALLQNKTFVDDEKNCFVDVRKVQRILPILHKKYPHEREAVAATRNQWGKAFTERYAVEWRRTTQDYQLQDVLRQWRAWAINSRIRDSPFSYKCYVCDSAWWSYGEFQTHITKHPDCKLQNEIRHQECSIVAYEGNSPVYKDLYVHGKCLKCAKRYDHHLTNKSSSDAYYHCNYCNERFQTCNTLTKHEGTCDRNPIRVLSITRDGKELTFSDFSCPVCDTVFLSNPDLSEHMTVCHRVRSDEPTVVKFKTCRLCNRNYCIFQFHVCAKKNLTCECKHCYSKFQNKTMLEHHTERWGGVVRCRVCDKFIMRGCMAAQHYALHSENFQLVHRCLVCRKKMKVFLNEAALKSHRSRYHNRVDYRRPCSDVIIIAKIMLEQCMMDPDAKKKVRVYVPITKKVKDTESSTNASLNTTIAHDNEVSLRTKEASDNIQIMIKEEKDSDTIEENLKIADKLPLKDNMQFKDKTVLEKENSEKSEVIIKTEKLDDNTAENRNSEEGKSITKETEGSKDLPQLIEELNEFIDIKPDIIKIKEEKLSEDETNTQGNLSSILQISNNDNIKKDPEISKVFQSSSTFAEEVTENSEHSTVFQVSKSILESGTNIKREIKDEPDDSDGDLVILESSSDSGRQESVTSDKSELSILNLEPEVILKAGYRKRKVYRCNKCDYSGYHREYKEHVNNFCKISKKSKKSLDHDIVFKCTKCGNGFANIKRYALHFEKHGYKYMSCPQCLDIFDSVTKLVTHLNNHIKIQFVRMRVIGDSQEKKKLYQCKTCKKAEDATNYFVHWEKHLEVTKEIKRTDTTEALKVGAKGEQSLEPEVLKEVLALLTQEERSSCPETKRIKTCNVCDRVFERRNDCKRHLIEHLLEDAFANIAEGQMLKCQICGELNKKPDSYKKHMRDHGSLPIYQCRLCDKTFSDSSNFTKHKKIHNLGAFVCDICSKKFQAKYSLEKHMEMHMKTAPITCERCDKVFHDRSFYNRHVRQFHDKLACRFKCTFCREKFSTLREKWDHMWLVHKQRKEKADCPICDRSFRKFTDVKKHAQADHALQLSLSTVWNLLSRIHNNKKIGGGPLERAERGTGERVQQGAGAPEGEATRGGERVQQGPTAGVGASEGEGTGGGGIRQGATAGAEVDAWGEKINKEEMESSDDDCLLIEEERETLIVYD